MYTIEPRYHFLKNIIIAVPLCSVLFNTVFEAKKIFVGWFYRFIENCFCVEPIVVLCTISPPKTMCIGVALIDTFSTIAAHLCFRLPHVLVSPL